MKHENTPFATIYLAAVEGLHRLLPLLPLPLLLLLLLLLIVTADNVVLLLPLCYALALDETINSRKNTVRATKGVQENDRTRGRGDAHARAHFYCARHTATHTAVCTIPFDSPAESVVPETRGGLCRRPSEVFS